jgi:hypothetical protein
VENHNFDDSHLPEWRDRRLTKYKQLCFQIIKMPHKNPFGDKVISPLLRPERFGGTVNAFDGAANGRTR